jgi:hypothetical protein
MRRNVNVILMSTLLMTSKGVAHTYPAHLANFMADHFQQLA